ncbi:MAG: Coenzyme F420 hydrogenase/dehydrogenase, beta subunit C-terminal domain [Bacteroidaceae bacterium]|nr:Coenzyme F420 hydrogenase/dehydrogenase, beta subunit C-terminal domain [Bacteroidaceae bacterium]
MSLSRIANHQICCGCTACEQICPQQCISMQTDEEGFLYPCIDETKCVDCGLCGKVCPALMPYPEHQPEKTFAAINDKESIRLDSSSGGLFSLFAEECIVHGCTIFGARFSPTWSVVHEGTNRIEDIPLYRGCKYVQSEMRHCYKEAEAILKKGKPVMFVGTPCQIAGLNHFLGKAYDRLLTVDFICHGVPSPAVWKWYINDVARKFVRSSILNSILYLYNPLRVIKSIEFRSKKSGWKQYCFVVKTKGMHGQTLTEVHYKNAYMRAFLTNLCLRPSCYNCKSKEGRSRSDLTIADFWNVHKVIDGFDDDKGTSLVLVNTEKGEEVFNSLKCRKQEVKFSEAIQYNPSWGKSYEENEKRKEFMESYTTHFFDFVQ